MNDCDLALMLGTDFPYRQFYPQGTAKIVQIDIRPEQLGRRAPIARGLVGDIAATIDALLPFLEERSDERFPQQAIVHNAKTRKGLDDLAKGTPRTRSSSIRSKSPRRSAIWRLRMRSSPAMSDCPPCGPLVILR